MLNSIRWLDSIGRKSRSKKNEKLENFLTDLQRLTIVHETDHNGSYYRFASTKKEEEGDNGKNDDKKGEAKSVDTKKQESSAKKGENEKKNGDDEKKNGHDEKKNGGNEKNKDDKGGEKGATGGDKGLSDHTGKGHEHAQAQDEGPKEVQPDGTQPKPDDQSSEGTHVDPN